MSISSHIVASLWTAATIDMSTVEEVTKSERIKMELIVITVVFSSNNYITFNNNIIITVSATIFRANNQEKS